MNVLGIDIGGSSIKAGLTDVHGVIRNKSTISVEELRKGDVVDNIINWVTPIISEHQPKSVGIGVPGLLSKDKKKLLEVPNLPEIEGFISSISSMPNTLT